MAKMPGRVVRAKKAPRERVKGNRRTVAAIKAAGGLKAFGKSVTTGRGGGVASIRTISRRAAKAGFSAKAQAGFRRQARRGGAKK